MGAKWLSWLTRELDMHIDGSYRLPLFWILEPISHRTSRSLIEATTLRFLLSVRRCQNRDITWINTWGNIDDFCIIHTITSLIWEVLWDENVSSPSKDVRFKIIQFPSFTLALFGPRSLTDASLSAILYPFSCLCNLLADDSHTNK